MPSRINIHHVFVFMLCLFHCIYLYILCLSSWAVWLTGCWNKSIYLSYTQAYTVRKLLKGQMFKPSILVSTSSLN